MAVLAGNWREWLGEMRDTLLLLHPFAGFSSGANVAASLRLLQERERGARIALTVNDSGLKYLSTDLFE